VGIQGNARGAGRNAGRHTGAGGFDLEINLENLRFEKMNLRSWIGKLPAPLFVQRWRMHFSARLFGQDGLARLEYATSIFMPLLSARRAAVSFCWGLLLVIPSVVFSQTDYYAANGTEYEVVGSLPGDQVFPDAAVTPSGGFVVWQDNATDGSGWGISARRVDGTLSGTLGTFRVNQTGAGDQENPRVSLLKNGGAVFVWQGGQKGFQHIYCAFVNPDNTFVTNNDVLVNNFTNNFQINPAVATLTNGNVVIVWGSFDEAGSTSLQDVYGQILSPTGQAIGTNFLINQFTSYNQRTPAVAPLQNGGFVVTWVSEQQRLAAPTFGTPSGSLTASTAPVPSVDIYARLYNSGGIAQSEFLVNTNFNPCANPSVAAASDGSFMVVWDARDMVNTTNGLDIFARSFSSLGVGGTAVLVNSYQYGDQYTPRISSIGTDYLVAWTSLAQDGSREGVYRQFLRSNGSAVGGEFLVNTTTVSEQMQQTVASDGMGQFLVVWTGYTGASDSFDLFAQRYVNVAAVLQPMAAPFVYAPFVVSNGVYQPQLVVSWPPLLGISVSNYEVYVDGATTSMAVTASNVWAMTAANGLTASSSHSFAVDYVTTDGRRSPISPSASGTTWSSCNYMNSDVPCDWISEMFTTNAWPSNVNTPIVPGGPTIGQVFLSGGNPLNPATWLRTTLAATSQGFFLGWNTVPGQTYQVQVKTNLAASWKILDGAEARFAAGTADSIFVGAGSSGYYRVLLLRQ
jgi:hypothetical protein